jgi:hypothetical protein
MRPYFRYLLVIVSFLFLKCVAAAPAKDAIEISNEISSHTEQLFYQKQFKDINHLETLYRTKQSRLPDGRWKLTFIYSNLTSVSEDHKENEWHFKFKLLNEWIKQTPKAQAPYLAKAESLINYAWDARGGDWGYKVPPQQYQLFQERMFQARQVLEYCSQWTSKNPYWYKLMEVIALAQNWPKPEFDYLYKKAINIAPTYYFIYFRAADYYQPRWHGSRRALRRFVEHAVDKSKRKEGMTLYTRIYWSQLWALRDNTFVPGYAEWPKMRQGFLDIEKDYPNSVWNLNAFGYYACLAEDWKTFDRLAKRIGTKPHLSIWSSASKYYTCKSHTANTKPERPNKEPQNIERKSPVNYI